MATGENDMNRSFLAAVMAAAVTAGGGLADSVRAEPLALFPAASADSLRVDVQYPYLYGGRRYCWYDGGWHGPGWYWCGYGWRRGFGWGGAVGWLGWSHEGFRGGVYHGGYRDGGYRGGNYHGGNYHGGGYHGGGHAGGPGGGHGGGHAGGPGGGGHHH